MEALLMSESEKLSISQDQYIKLWFKNDARMHSSINHWNMYTEYFKDHMEEELGRVPGTLSVPREYLLPLFHCSLTQDLQGDNVPPHTRSACYNAFKAETNWQMILEMYHIQDAQWYRRDCCSLSLLLWQTFNKVTYLVSVLCCNENQ
jgi:hypothetical protein